MSKTSLEEFIDFLDSFKESGGFIGVIMSLPNQEKPELIVNVPKSLIIKSQYYKTAYNPDLTLKNNPDVKIISYNWTTDFELLGKIYATHLEEML